MVCDLPGRGVYIALMETLRRVMANGLALPALGQGSWNLGDDPVCEVAEIAALRRGLELGMNLIDTAEMYGDGRAERFIQKALIGVPRDDVVLVSKVYPHNAGRPQIFQSCDQSLQRLGTAYLDLYLLHWRGDVPLAETVECMESLVREGKIRRWGVSNFDVADMEALLAVPGGENCAVNQVLYHVGSRGIEFDLLPWLSEHNIAVMAYCPLAQGGRLTRLQDIVGDATLLAIAAQYDVTVFQVLLAFTLRQPQVLAIPKASSVAHVEANRAALDLEISAEDWVRVDAVFWPPTAKMHLDMD